MNISSFNYLNVSSYDGLGLQRVVESGEWFVGIKNYKPFNDVNNLESLERHLLTDEVFVLLEGKCVLLVDSSSNKDCSSIEQVSMDNGKVYCINKGVWHNTILSKDAKLILVENRNTSNENSEVYNLDLAAKEEIIIELKNTCFRE